MEMHYYIQQESLKCPKKKAVVEYIPPGVHNVSKMVPYSLHCELLLTRELRLGSCQQQSTILGLTVVYYIGNMDLVNCIPLYRE